MLTEEVVKRVDSGKKQSDVVERTIRHMAESLNASVQAFQQITAATGQQQIGFDQVTQALRNIRQAADQTAVSTSQLEKAATNLDRPRAAAQLRTSRGTAREGSSPAAAGDVSSRAQGARSAHSRIAGRVRVAPVACSPGTDLDDVFRRAHSLKGAARAVDLRPLESLAHRLETLFSRVREGVPCGWTPPPSRCLSCAGCERGLAGCLGGAARARAAVRRASRDRGDCSAPAARRGGTRGGRRRHPRAHAAPQASVAPRDRSPPPLAPVDMLRLNAASLDRIVSSSGQLLTESLRQTHVTRSSGR